MEKLTLKELANLFPDGIPIIVMKILFPEKSEGLTPDELRQVMNLFIDNDKRADKIEELAITYSVLACRGMADWACYEAGIDKGVKSVADAVRQGKL